MFVLQNVLLASDPLELSFPPVAFFILLGIGIDDTFVIAEHLYGPDHQEAGDEQLPVEERIAKAIAKAGSSILVTSATDIIAFLAGMFTTLPAPFAASPLWASSSTSCSRSPSSWPSSRGT